MNEPDYVFEEYEVPPGHPNPESSGLRRTWGVDEKGGLYMRKKDALGNAYWSRDSHGHNNGQALARELCRVAGRLEKAREEVRAMVGPGL